MGIQKLGKPIDANPSHIPTTWLMDTMILRPIAKSGALSG
jgi:hypothetical protein